MLRLLRSNITRIIKSKTFWISLSAYAIYAIIIILSCTPWNYETGEFSAEYVLGQNYGLDSQATNILSVSFPLQGLMLAVISCIIFLPDYHNSTIKNKLVIGHTKTQIYLSNYLSVAFISFALNVVYLLFFFALALPLYASHPNFSISATKILLSILDGTLMMFAYSAVITLVMMTSKNSFITLVATIVLLGTSILLIMLYKDVLNVPEFIFSPACNDYVPNSNYPDKSLRHFCQFMLDFFPSGQSYQLADNNPRWQIALYSLLMIPASTYAGTIIFNKTNIK